MTSMRNLALIGALFAAAPALAEEAHHAEGTKPATPPTAVAPGGQPGMMPGGMMGPGMMPMMSMMAAMEQMMAPEHVEGRIAFLRTELAITEAQLPLWNAFAEALRVNARGMASMMGDMQGGMMMAQNAAPMTLPQRIERHERMLTTRLDSLRRVKAALEPLYAAFDDTQKQAADKLLMAGPMGPM